jgi:hypothetical protein
MNETDKLITDTVNQIWSNSTTLRFFDLQQIITDAIYKAKMQGITSVASELGVIVHSECVEEEQI